MNSIRAKMICAISVILVLTGSVLSYIIFNSMMDLSMSIARERVQIAAEKACEQIDTANFTKLTKAVKQDPANEKQQKLIMKMPEYVELYQKLASIREGSGLRYLYTMIETDNKQYMYIVDGSNEEDISSPGVIETENYPLMPVAFKTGQTAVTNIDHSEKWGATLSAYVPIRDNSGQVIGIVGADYDAVRIDRAMQDTKQMVIYIVIGCLTVAVIAGMLFSRRITQQLQGLGEHIALIAEGDLTQRLHISGRDEVGRLAQVMDTMIVQLRSMITEISRTAENVAASAEELTANTEHSADAVNRVSDCIVNAVSGTEQQMALVTQAVDVTEQVLAGIQNLAVSAQAVEELSGKSAQVAQEGSQVICVVNSQMHMIEDKVGTSMQTVKKLGERSKEIGQIVDTISGIAGQTNLLALNAAIEAARAGEHGRGFSVVAEEVSKLAEQSQVAAKQIANLISGIQAETNEAVLAMHAGSQEVQRGNEVVQEASQKFNEIADLVDIVSLTMQETTQEVAAMLDRSRQIVSAVHDIDEISKGIAAQAQTVSAATDEQSVAMEQINEASQVLANMAQNLQNVIRQFKV